MSRSHHGLRSAEWYPFARLCHLDNRELRRRTQHKRERDRVRVDEQQLFEESTADEAERRANAAYDRAHALCLAGIELCGECLALEREQWGDYLDEQLGTNLDDDEWSWFDEYDSRR